jgi:pyruvate/2-oxoglutarate dehydrogenase complex dihydrolipoamide acyltransferase (E2) component
MPRLGHSMTEGTVVAWLAPTGAEVRAGQPVASIETEKAEYQIEAPADGRMSPPVVLEGATAEVGAVLAYVLAPGEVIEHAATAAAPPSPSGAGHAPAAAARAGGGAPVSPRARRLAHELGVDLSSLRGSGADGLIVEADVQRAAASGSPAVGRPIRERRQLTPVQKTSARRVTEAWRDVPHIVQMIDADVAAIQRLRDRWKAEASPLAAITFTDFVLKAGAQALTQHPALNASIEGDELLLFGDVNAGVAVDTPRGLLVPVVRNADRRTLLGVALESRRLAEAARQHRLTPDLMGSGSFTVSNLGRFGIRAGLPILNPPEAVLVFVGAVEERAVAREGTVVVRPMVTLSIAYDHRVADGVAAARLSGAIKALLETPEPLLAGVN